MRFICWLLAVVVVIVNAKMQNVTVKGTTICNKKRMAGVTVELWERDTRVSDLHQCRVSLVALIFKPIDYFL
ncbi:hypothetical protein DICVIV_05866 [Dictyocaulus viviparus]|uniref:Transthyretin-like family protein n=1 Tax=Dictyocaulus viviparus TaxID=29172 RepID=A0A0D8Y093_DICVI|nr:hypothetical protein DICVIV_05866 [Dictyocaulus viviparus]